MNRIILTALISISITMLSAQTIQVNLTQAPGVFTTNELALAAGSYQFNIENQGVDHEVGFVLVPKGKYEPTDHIQAAYVKETVATGKSSLTNVVTLKAGEYEYFCPMNPTPKYRLLENTGLLFQRNSLYFI